jgi:hypothetical protein
MSEKGIGAYETRVFIDNDRTGKSGKQDNLLKNAPFNGAFFFGGKPGDFFQRKGGGV